MITVPIHTIDKNSQDLQQRVALTLQRRELVFASRVRIEAQHGIIILSGLVPTFYQRQLIYAATRRVAGVLKVIDRLEVETAAGASSPFGGRIIA